MKQENIVAIGVRKSSKDEDKTVFFFDYLCDCGKNSITEFPDEMDVEGFVDMMVQEYIDGNAGECEHEKHHKTSNKNNKKNVKSVKSKIPPEEVEEFKKFLNKCKDFQSLLLGIGVSPEDINKKNA
jgi:hypothetical protein